MKNLLQAFIIIVVTGLIAAGIVGGCAYSGYKKVIGMDEQIKSSWAQVENIMQSRFDQIPNLVETVKGVAGQEKEVFINVAQARSQYLGAENTNEKAAAASSYLGATVKVLSLQETYPELKSNESFLKLQDVISGMENRLAVERKRYNDAVRALNAYIRAFPGKMYAGWVGVEPAEYFEVEEQAQATPKVDFNDD